MNKLDFEMPAFMRLTWVNDQAAMTWQQRFIDIRKAFQQIAIDSVGQNGRKLAQLSIPIQSLEAWNSLIEKSGLVAMQGAKSNESINGIDLPLLQLYIAKEEKILLEYQAAVEKRDIDEMGKLLAYPDCCVSHYKTKIDSTCESDPSWAIIENTKGYTPKSLSNVAGFVQREFTLKRSNPIYHKLGLMPFFHFPCSFECEHTASLAEEFLKLGCTIGHCTEMDWLKEVLEWPVEWTLLHGIAELKTPVFKMISNAPSTAEKYTLRILGDQFPLFSETGLHFPYAKPKKRKVTESNSYKKGLENPIQKIAR